MSGYREYYNNNTVRHRRRSNFPWHRRDDQDQDSRPRVSRHFSHHRYDEEEDRDREEVPIYHQEAAPNPSKPPAPERPEPPPPETISFVANPAHVFHPELQPVAASLRQVETILADVRYWLGENWQYTDILYAQDVRRIIGELGLSNPLACVDRLISYMVEIVRHMYPSTAAEYDSYILDQRQYAALQYPISQLQEMPMPMPAACPVPLPPVSSSSSTTTSATTRKPGGGGGGEGDDEFLVDYDENDQEEKEEEEEREQGEILEESG